MRFDQFAAAVQVGAASLGVTAEGEVLKALFTYFQELRHWSAKMNLVSRETADEELIDQHFIDSLSLLSLLDERPGRLLDVGSGAGFPGLVVKILRPGFGVDLLEPRLKRVSFLRHVIRTLGLADIEVFAERLETGHPPPGGREYGWVVSRAVMSIGEFLARCGHFHDTGCRVLFMKGPRCAEEMAAVGGLPLSWRMVAEKTYRLPVSGAERVVLAFQGEQEYL